MSKKELFLVALVLIGTPALSQTNQIAKFFPAAAVPTGGQSNLDLLVGGYITPVAEDFGALGNGGWYHTAENHKKWGFDLSVTMNAISANSDSKYFGINALQDVTYNGTSMGGTKSPTAYGPESEFPLFTYNNTSNPALNAGAFAGPGGGNISSEVPIGSLAMPTIQGGLGLFANTDIRFRYTPEVKIGSTSTNSFGFGLLHDIKQHIPAIKMLPFSLSAFVAYNKSTATTSLEGLYTNPGSEKQEGSGETTGYTAQILISKSIPVLTFYGGIGYNSATTNYAIKGSYLVDKAFVPGVGSVALLAPVTLTNPFSKDYTSSGFRATAGIRFKFGPVFLNGDYTWFNSKGVIALGFGFTVR